MFSYKFRKFSSINKNITKKVIKKSKSEINIKKRIEIILINCFVCAINHTRQLFCVCYKSSSSIVFVCAINHPRQLFMCVL